MKADWTTECTKQRRNRNRILFREGTVKCLRYCSCIRKLKSLASRKSIAYKAIRYAEKDTTHTSSTVSRAYTAVIGDCCRITQNDRQPCLGLLVNTKSCNGTVQRAIEKDSLILETFLVRCRTVSLLLQQLSKPRAFTLQLSRGKAQQAYERGTRTLPNSCRTDFNKSS